MTYRQVLEKVFKPKGYTDQQIDEMVCDMKALEQFLEAIKISKKDDGK